MAKKPLKKKVGKKKSPKWAPSGPKKSPLAGVDLQDIWPQERDFMERPDRYRYVRKIIRPDGCVFCQARDQGVTLESLVLYREEHALVVLNK
ncbi:MAG: HIT domain-containing protein, partial [Bdellovibrionales bacterium]|nr:HIT domain-containing protein [Bdellovibrionales bacterium]